jgi:hypothetical protein
MHGHYTDILWCTVIILMYYDARSLYWYTMMHGHYTDIIRCTVTILIYYDARSLYWYTMMHGHYTDIIWCTVTILIYYDARSLYWYTMMHGHYTDILWCTVNKTFSLKDKGLPFWWTLQGTYYKKRVAVKADTLNGSIYGTFHYAGVTGNMAFISWEFLLWDYVWLPNVSETGPRKKKSQADRSGKRAGQEMSSWTLFLAKSLRGMRRGRPTLGPCGYWITSLPVPTAKLFSMMCPDCSNTG